MLKPNGRQSSEETVIRPPGGLGFPSFSDLWRYRELLYYLTKRDIVVRYRQAVLGVVWAVLQPVLLMVVFTLIFGNLAGLPSDGKPYALMTFAGLLPWQLFANTVQRSAVSLTGSANLITKVFFPRIIVPIAAALSPLVDFLIAAVVMGFLMVYYQQPVGWTTLMVFPLTALAFLTGLAFGVWLSALNVMYRDVQYIVPFGLQFWMFLSPVAYSASIVPEGAWQVVYALNPMVGVIQGFRWALLGETRPELLVVVSAAMVVAILVSGAVFFARTERDFADVV